MAIMQSCSKDSNDKVGLPSENEITKILLPRLNESANSAQSTIISVVKDSISFETNLSNLILLKNKKIYQLNSESIVDLNVFLYKKDNVYCYSLFAAIVAIAVTAQERNEKYEKISVYPVIRVRLENSK